MCIKRTWSWLFSCFNSIYSKIIDIKIIITFNYSIDYNKIKSIVSIKLSILFFWNFIIKARWNILVEKLVGMQWKFLWKMGKLLKQKKLRFVFVSCDSYEVNYLMNNNRIVNYYFVQLQLWFCKILFFFYHLNNIRAKQLGEWNFHNFLRVLPR